MAATSSSAASSAREHANGVPSQDLTGLGQPDVAPDSLHEDRPGALLQATDHLGDGRL